ncbi:hypothetical protein [Desnuesiella massiliensis]|uniref:hypothetical protein n=1 Tax=Desnuesiella massiliensis TaxID=1650662 RepID=UPI0006E20F56|nr:hypothetical protein [Desnuesiella massiliensis]
MDIVNNIEEWEFLTNISIHGWEKTLKAIKQINFDLVNPKLSNRDKMVRDFTEEDYACITFSVLDNFIEQQIAVSLTLSLYGMLEDWILNLTGVIETKGKKEYKQYCREKNKPNNINTMKLYIEEYSNIKFNTKIFSEILALKTIRNTFIHNGNELDKYYYKYLSQIKKFSIIDDSLEVVIYLTSDLTYIDKILALIRLFFDDIMKQGLVIKN